MTKVDHLVEQHVREYQSRLKHIDELLARARAAARGRPSPEQEELEALRRKRDELASEFDRLGSLKDWREEELEKAGPMGVWDAVAQQLEALVERLEGRAD